MAIYVIKHFTSNAHKKCMWLCDKLFSTLVKTTYQESNQVLNFHVFMAILKVSINSSKEQTNFLNYL